MAINPHPASRTAELERMQKKGLVNPAKSGNGNVGIWSKDGVFDPTSYGSADISQINDFSGLLQYVLQNSNNTDSLFAILQFITQLKNRDEDFQNSTPSAQLNRLVAAGMSPSAALAALSGQQYSGVTPTETSTGSTYDSLFNAGARIAEDSLSASSTAISLANDAYKTYIGTQEQRFLDKGRELVEPIAGSVYSWIIDHEGDPAYVVSDEAKRSPENFKRWCLEKDENGNYIRPDAERLMKSDAWDKMSHSLAGVAAFRREFAGNIEGRTPREMEWDANHNRLQRSAELQYKQAQVTIAKRDATVAAMEDFVYQVNTGMYSTTDENGSTSWTTEVPKDSPYYDIFFDESGNLRKELPLIIDGIAADLENSALDSEGYNGIVGEKWSAEYASLEHAKNADLLESLIYGDMMPIYQQIKATNPPLGDALFGMQMVYQHIYGTTAGSDKWTTSGSYYLGERSADAADVVADSRKRTADVKEREADLQERHEANIESSDAEIIRHNKAQERIDAYKARTERIRTKYGTRKFGIITNAESKDVQGVGLDNLHTWNK